MTDRNATNETNPKWPALWSAADRCYNTAGKRRSPFMSYLTALCQKKEMSAFCCLILSFSFDNTLTFKHWFVFLSSPDYSTDFSSCFSFNSFLYLTLSTFALHSNSSPVVWSLWICNTKYEFEYEPVFIQITYIMETVEGANSSATECK